MRRADGSFAERAEVYFGEDKQHKGLDGLTRGEALPYLVDWDRDGHTDLVVGYKGRYMGDSWTLHVGLGPFADKKDLTLKPVNLPAIGGASPVYFAFVDWDGDGRKDLLVGVEWQRQPRYTPDGSYPSQPLRYSVCWFRNTSDTGPPKFAEAAHLLDIPEPLKLHALTAIDWEGDGRPSLVVSVSKGLKLGDGGGWGPVASELWLYRSKAEPRAADPEDGKDTRLGLAEEAAAVRAVDKLGGRVSVDPKQPGKPVVGVDFGQTQVTDAALKELKAFKSLHTLRLYVARVTDAGLKELKELRSLQWLSLDLTGVTDEGLKDLKELKSLQTLILNDTQITDAGLKELRELKSLQELWLRSTKVTDAGLKELKDLKSLHTLVPDHTHVTDAGLKELRELKSLRRLWLQGLKVTDEGMKELKELKSLQVLWLNSTMVTDEGLKELKDLKSLHTLVLDDTHVTDAGLKELRELKSLRELWLNHTMVTDAGVKELKAALPEVRVSR
jgi:internalin A